MRISDWSADVCSSDRATAGFEGVTLNAESLNALNASRQVIGGQFSVLYGQGGNYITPQRVSRSVALREGRSEEHTSELQSLMRISYAVFCLKKKPKHMTTTAIQLRQLHTNRHHT